MEPNARSMFDEVLQRLDGMESRSSERWERWEKRLTEADAERKEHDDAVDERLLSLENFASAQYNAAAVADNWGSHFEDRLQDLEHRQADLELIRIHEIRDERDDRVEAVESEVKGITEWRPLIDGSIDYLRTEVRRLSRHWDRALVDPTLPQAGIMSSPELVAARSSAGPPTDWPSGHHHESTTRERYHGSISTLVPNPANGTCIHPYLGSIPLPINHHPPSTDFASSTQYLSTSQIRPPHTYPIPHCSSSTFPLRSHIPPCSIFIHSTAILCYQLPHFPR